MNTSRTLRLGSILAGDVGGTNINLAIVRIDESGPSIRFQRRYSTQEATSLEEPVMRFLAEAKSHSGDLAPILGCISAAGVLHGRRVELTNAAWAVDGDSLHEALDLDIHIINDFTAICYGILLLDPDDESQLTVLEHSDGSRPLPVPGGIKAVLGAGTGLGLSCIIHEEDREVILSSEGGHATLPVYDNLTRRLQEWLETRYGCTPGAEAAISGQGIANIYEFLVSQESIPSPARQAIMALPFAERPARIASASETDPAAQMTMAVFVDLYARKASDVAATFLSRGGLYLAGGIAARNTAWFTQDRRFMSRFERSYAQHIRRFLADVPVMIVKDYSVSLYGAANAALALTK